MSKNRIVWSDELGDLRKKLEPQKTETPVKAESVTLHVRRLTSGKGRTVVEISNLPTNKKWCEDLAKAIKKSMGVGGTYKNNYIEIHGEKIEAVTKILESQNIKWKKIGG